MAQVKVNEKFKNEKIFDNGQGTEGEIKVETTTATRSKTFVITLRLTDKELGKYQLEAADWEALKQSIGEILEESVEFAHKKMIEYKEADVLDPNQLGLFDENDTENENT